MREGGFSGTPERVVVVGAGVVGLSTAWFLQEHGVDVSIVDREDVAAGASWGNAGYLSPSFAVPLPEPAVLRYGLRTLFDRSAPLYIPAAVDPGLGWFLLQFVRNCTTKTWCRSMRSYVPMNAQCLDAFDALAAGGVHAPTTSAPLTAAFESADQVVDLRRELERVRACGQAVGFSEPSLSEVEVPQLSARVGAVLRVQGQRYVDPGAFVRELATSVETRGGRIRSGCPVSEVTREDGQVFLTTAAGERISADAVVVSTGAWLGALARPHGVRRQVRAGRGYSFTVPTEDPVPGPIHLPSARVACTPYRGALRVAGTMEFRPPDAAMDRARIDAIARSARRLLTGVAWEQRTDEWVGPRPCTADGLPLIGATRTPGVFVAGGHGMWGLTLGPVTGRLLSEQITSGRTPESLVPFDPLR